ncbi:MAG: hypothetical protein COX19_16700 [Desulfobacterales bacterium CG23_combo_of_CG06-09_8_20_14_all_51_8]|nr:MAG: hypothetical protein COX19_16700 [Desulfobacterales bacterium CG23_combo_of_CG06-09_8_20_14_all_51_8]
MFFDLELKSIEEAKDRLAICCDLRRRLVHIEIIDFWGGVRRTLSNVTLGVAVAEQIIGLLRDRKGRRR